MVGYRSGEAYSEQGLTALDVVRYEQEELGNELVLLLDEKELNLIPMRQAAWVCASEEDAKRYGDDVETVEYSQVLAADNEDPRGYLVKIA